MERRKMIRQLDLVNIQPLVSKNKQSKKYLLLLFILFVMHACGTAKLNMEDVLELEEIHGIHYQKIEHDDQTVHVLRIDPNRSKTLLHKAKTLEYTSELAKKNKAIVAINAGFFEADGSPAGALKINGKWINYPVKNRGVVGWEIVNKNYKFYFDRLGPNMDKKGIDSTLKKDFSKSELWWEKAENIAGGAPLLIYEGKILDPKSEKTFDTFIKRKYARTAIGVDGNNKLIIVVVEGGNNFSWKLGWRYGMNLNELSNFMQSLGCQYALNLDGGQSSTLIVNRAMVNSQPIIYGERKVSDVILLK